MNNVVYNNLHVDLVGSAYGPGGGGISGDRIWRENRRIFVHTYLPIFHDKKSSETDNLQ